VGGVTGVQSKSIPFRVDLPGLLEIMGRSLYSRADTPIRELIQNAHDAIIRRRQRDLNFTGRIDIRQDAEAEVLQFHDDGIGLTPAEAEEYLGTLGLGMTGLVKKRLVPGGEEAVEGLIGQFGVGLFSAFLLTRRLVVDSLAAVGGEAVRWEAGADTQVQLGPSDRTTVGTTVTLHLRPEHRNLARNPEVLERSIREYADFLPIPIFLNDDRQRVNVIEAAWLEPTPDREAVELELEAQFGESPLDVICLRQEQPVSVAGALYISPQRVPGFAEDPGLTVTLRRMVISRRLRGLLPGWATFVRGVLEVNDCAPTANREDLVRDGRFDLVRQSIEMELYQHLEGLESSDPSRLMSLIAWHRFSLTGAALEQPRLRELLRRVYRFSTSQGDLTVDQILKRSPADPLVEPDAERVVWYNPERRQENWMNDLFGKSGVPCVHVLRSFEEGLLVEWIGETEGAVVRLASPAAPQFAASVLGARDYGAAPDNWQRFLGASQARVHCAELTASQPVLAFLNERSELHKTFEQLRARGTIPPGFQRLIDTHFEQGPIGQNEILLNSGHPLVARALEVQTSHPLASVVRLLAWNALTTAGAVLPPEARRQQEQDLAWIGETLGGRPG